MEEKVVDEEEPEHTAVKLQVNLQSIPTNMSTEWKGRALRSAQPNTQKPSNSQAA